MLLANYYTLQKAVLGPHLSDVSCVLISSLNLVMTALGALSSCANITVFLVLLSDVILLQAKLLISLYKTKICYLDYLPISHVFH